MSNLSVCRLFLCADLVVFAPLHTHLKSLTNLCAYGGDEPKISNLGANIHTEHMAYVLNTSILG